MLSFCIFLGYLDRVYCLLCSLRVYLPPPQILGPWHFQYSVPYGSFEQNHFSLHLQPNSLFAKGLGHHYYHSSAVPGDYTWNAKEFFPKSLNGITHM